MTSSIRSDRPLRATTAATPILPLMTIRIVIGDLLRDETDGVLERLARSEMIPGEDADDDRPAVGFEHPDVIADEGEEVAGLVRDAITGHVAGDARPIQLSAHDLQHEVR